MFQNWKIMLYFKVIEIAVKPLIGKALQVVQVELTHDVYLASR